MAARSSLNVRSNGLDDLQTAIYDCPNHTDDSICSDYGYPDTWDNSADHLKQNMKDVDWVLGVECLWAK